MPKITRYDPLPTLPAIKRVAAYARVSSGKDAMLHSLSSQVSYFNEYIQSQRDWQFAGVFYDEGKTGTKENRDGFQRMLAACRAGKIDMIIVKSITRFSRNTLTILKSVRELKEVGVDVFCQKENLHTLGSDGELMLTILAAMAQEESKSASDNQKWRIRHAFERGEVVCWSNLYGYRIREGKATIVPEEATVVREVYKRVIDGESLGSIARDLEARGRPRPMGGAWSHHRIREMIENEKYVGRILLQKTIVVDHLEKKRIKNSGELPRYILDDVHEPIIDKESYDAANAVLQRYHERAAKRPRQHDSAFTGMIRCESCGKNYCRAANGPTMIWNCQTYKRMGPRGCPAKQIREETLYAISAEVLGVGEFDPEMFLAQISAMRVEQNQTLVYCFRDGHEVRRQWTTPSRRDRWTLEMKEKARQKYLAQKGEAHAESNRHTGDH